MGRHRIISLPSAEETLLFGARFASSLLPGQIVALKGDLGAGKTTFVQGLLQGLHIQDTATSPTFTLLQTYAEKIHHFDLYRIASAAEFTRLGFDEFLGGNGIALIEWPERIAPLLPPDAWLIEFFYHPTGRTACIKRWEDL